MRGHHPEGIDATEYQPHQQSGVRARPMTNRGGDNPVPANEKDEKDNGGDGAQATDSQELKNIDCVGGDAVPGERQPLAVIRGGKDIVVVELAEGDEFIESLSDRSDGKLILVTAISPTPAGEGKTTTTVGLGDGLNRIGDVPIYAVDAMVRRASALQETSHAAEAAIGINVRLAERIGLVSGDQARVRQNGSDAVLLVSIDSRLPDDCVRVPAGLGGSLGLGENFGPIELEKS